MFKKLKEKISNFINRFRNRKYDDNIVYVQEEPKHLPPAEETWNSFVPPVKNHMDHPPLKLSIKEFGIISRVIARFDERHVVNHDTTVCSYHESHIVAHDNCWLWMYDKSRAIIHDKCRANVFDGSIVLADDNSKVNAYRSSIIIANGSCTVYAYDDVIVYRNSPDAEIHLVGNAVEKPYEYGVLHGLE